jgi:hypothetical protein
MAKPKSSSGRGKRGAKAKSQRQPVVFMLQPMEYVPARPRRMKQWEDALRSVFGKAAPQIHKNLLTAGLIETTSVCHPGGACDCDVREHDPIA